VVAPERSDVDGNIALTTTVVAALLCRGDCGRPSG
jgi:hypothetical protein